jgi:hypothetical protein
MFKEIIGIFAAGLVFAAYGPYMWDVFKGKTKPHPYSWFIWGLLTGIIFALQVTNDAGAGSYVTLTVTVLSFVISGMGFKSSRKDITTLDTICFISALLATALWLFAHQPTLSMIILVSIDLFGFAPTIRKAWNKPHEETLLTWEINGLFAACS